MTRDQFLLEKLDLEYWWCGKCQKGVEGRHVTYQENYEACGYPVIPIDFSTWEGFGALWEKCISSEKEWLSKFMNWWALQFPGGWEAWLKWERLSPDERSDAVAKYLGWEEK